MTNLKTGIWTMGKEGCSSSIEGFYSSIRGETKRRKYYTEIFLIPCCFEDFVTMIIYVNDDTRSSVGNEIYVPCSSPISTVRIFDIVVSILVPLLFLYYDLFHETHVQAYSPSSEIYLFFELFWEKVRKINKLVFL